MRRIPLLVALAVLLMNPAVWAARVVLKNGSTFDGTLLRQDGNSVTLKTGLGEITFARSQIARLEGVESADESTANKSRSDAVVERPRTDPPSAERFAEDRPTRTPSPPEERSDAHAALLTAHESEPVERTHRAAPIAQPIRVAEEDPPAESENAEGTRGAADESAGRNFEKEIKRALGRSGASWGLGFLAGVLGLYVVASFVLATLITWAVAHMMSSVSDPSYVNALKVTGIQWGAAIFILVLFGVFLAVMGAGSDPNKLALAGGAACCALPVVLLAMIGVNIGAVTRVLGLGIGQAILFVIAQGFGGWLVDLALRQALIGALMGK